MYLEDRTVRLQLWDTAGQVKKSIRQPKQVFTKGFLYIGKIP